MEERELAVFILTLEASPAGDLKNQLKHRDPALRNNTWVAWHSTGFLDLTLAKWSENKHLIIIKLPRMICRHEKKKVLTEICYYLFHSTWITFLVLNSFLWLLINQSLRASVYSRDTNKWISHPASQELDFSRQILAVWVLGGPFEQPAGLPRNLPLHQGIFSANCHESLHKLIFPISKEAKITDTLSICILTLPLPRDISTAP